MEILSYSSKNAITRGKIAESLHQQAEAEVSKAESKNPKRFKDKFWSLFSATTTKEQYAKNPEQKTLFEELSNASSSPKKQQSPYGEIQKSESSAKSMSGKSDLEITETDDSFDIRQYAGTTYPVSRLLINDNNRELFKMELENIRLELGNEYSLLYSWKLIKYTKNTKKYKLIGMITNKGELESLIASFKQDMTESQIVILLKNGCTLRSNKTGAKIMAFQIVKEDEYSVFKSFVRLVCDESVNYDDNIDDSVNIYSLSFNSQAFYAVLKLYLENSNEAKQEHLLKILKNRLPEEYQYVCDSVKYI